MIHMHVLSLSLSVLLIVSQNLKWKSHTDMIAGKIGKNVGLLHKLKHYLPRKIMLIYVYSLLNSKAPLHAFLPKQLCVKTLKSKFLSNLISRYKKIDRNQFQNGFYSVFNITIGS